MSLINQMLKDLEERRPADARRDTVLQDISAPRRAAPERRRPWLPWAITTVLAIGVGALLLERVPVSTPTLPPVTTPDSAAIDPPAAQATSAAIPQPAVTAAAVTESAIDTPVQAEAAAAPIVTQTSVPPSANATQPATHAISTPASPTDDTAAAAPAKSVADTPAEPEPIAAASSAPAASERTVVAVKTAEPAPAQAQTPAPNPPTPIIVTPATRPTATTGKNARPSPPQVVEKTAHPLNSEQQAERWYQDGVKQLRLGRLARAEDLLREALASSPRHAPARQAIAGLLINGGRSDEALQVLAQGLALDKRQAELAKLYARLLLERGAAGEAGTALEQAAPPIGADPDYHALLAAVYQRLNQHQAAANHYRALVQLRPGQGVWWMGLGISTEALGDRAGAIQAYQQAVASGALASDLQRYVQTKLSTLQAAP